MNFWSVGSVFYLATISCHFLSALLTHQTPPPTSSRWSSIREVTKRHLPNKIIVPVEILLAVDIAIFDEAGHLWVQRQFALAALQTRGVPLSVYRDQVVSVGDPPTAAVTHRSLCTGARAGRRRPHGLPVLQHPAVTISPPGRNLFSCKIRAFYNTESYVTVLWIMTPWSSAVTRGTDWIWQPQFSISFCNVGTIYQTVRRHSLQHIINDYPLILNVLLVCIFTELWLWFYAVNEENHEQICKENLFSE
jgi:hypothetical protein